MNIESAVSARSSGLAVYVVAEHVAWDGDLIESIRHWPGTLA